MADTFTVSETRANLPKLVKRDSFAISERGKVIGVYLSKDRIEGLIETVELLSDDDFLKAHKNYKFGKMRFKDLSALDEG